MAKNALCIGINDYPGTGGDLAGCVNDARDWARALLARGFKVRTLFDHVATGARMRKEMAALVEGARKGDILVMQFSGHGSFVPDEDGDEPDGTDECLCPWDVRANGPIADDELFAICGARAAGVRLFMVAASCHSGTVARFAPIRTPPAVRGAAAPRLRSIQDRPALHLDRTVRLGRVDGGLDRRVIRSGRRSAGARHGWSSKTR